MRNTVLLVLTVCLQGISGVGVEFFVAPGANASGVGSQSNPWPLQVALTNQTIMAGDTIWLRGGTYFPPLRILAGTNVPQGEFGWYVSISGSPNSAITLRSYGGEWAKIDRPWRLGASDYLRFRDLEFYNSLKGFDPGHPWYPNARPWGHFDDARARAQHEWINCVIHDVNNVWSGAAAGKVIRGCIIWHSGNSALDHVCYNTPDEFSGNISGWHSCDALNLTPRPFLCRSNIFFGAGQAQQGVSSGDFRLNTNSVVAFNYIYNRYSNNVLASSMIVSQGSFDISNNVIVTPSTCIKLSGSSVAANVHNNTLHMASPFADYAVLSRGTTNNSWSFKSNYYSAQPASRSIRFEDPHNVSRTFSQWSAAFGFETGSTSANAALPPDSIHVIPNQDEPKRAHIAIYNFSSKNVVSVSLSGVLNAGNSYSLYSAQDFGAGPIQTGTYNGESISVPMTNLSVAPLLYSDPHWGLVAPPPTSPEFAAFVVIGTIGQAPARPSSLQVISPR